MPDGQGDRHRPARGHAVAEGHARSSCSISTGPDAGGRPQRRSGRPQAAAEARAARHRSGSGVAEQLVNAGDPTNAGKVVAQTPAGGEAPKGSTIVIVDRSLTARAAGTTDHGRHDLPWRQTRDRWAILVSEVMLHQTQVPRVAAVYDDVPRALPDAGGDGRRRAGRGDRRHGAASATRGGRAASTTPRWCMRDARLARRPRARCPGIGRYTAAAILAQADDADVPAIEVNVRRVVERVRGARLAERAAEAAMVRVGRPLHGRDRLLALMDVGALAVPAARPALRRVPAAPTVRDAVARSPDETRHRQAPFAGSFRQRRGAVMARLRAGPVAGRRARRRGARVAGRRRPRGRRRAAAARLPSERRGRVRCARTPRKLPRSE